MHSFHLEELSRLFATKKVDKTMQRDSGSLNIDINLRGPGLTLLISALSHLP